MNPQTKEVDHQVSATALPDLPPQGHVLCRMAIGHLPSPTARELMTRLVERSAYGAKKFGHQWRGRKNTVELCEETTDAIVYASQETANIDLGLTPVEPGSCRANVGKNHLLTAARYAALSDHYSQEAHAVIWENAPVDGECTEVA